MPFEQISPILACAFVAVGLLLAFRGAKTLVADRSRRETWQTVPGRVVESRLDDEGQFRSCVAFERNGQKHVFWNRYSATHLVDPVGREVEVLVNPENPADAVVSRGLAAGGRLVGMSLVAGGLLFATVGAVVGVRLLA